jgi:hypothetical protein
LHRSLQPLATALACFCQQPLEHGVRLCLAVYRLVSSS